MRRPDLSFAVGTPAWRQLLLGVAAFVLAILLGFLLAFPTAPLKQTMVDAFKPYRASAELESLRLSPLLALQGQNLTIRMDNASLPPLEVKRFSLRPVWLSLLSAEPGMTIAAELLEGTLQVVVHKGGRLQARASGQRWVLPLMDGAATVMGTLSTGRLLRSAGDIKTAERTLSLDFATLLVQSPLLADTANRPLDLGQLTLEASGRGQVFNVTRLESRGGDLTLTGTGSVLIGRTPASSRLSLNLTLRPTATLPGGVKDLLALMAPPAGDGSYQLRIGGTLAMPTMLLQSGGRAPAAATQDSGNRNSATEPMPDSDEE